MVKVGIIGATGYAGNELVRLLMGHKDVEIMWYGSRNYIDKKYAEVYQNMFEIVEDTCLDDNMEELASKVDVIFTATPQGFLAGVLTEEILSRVKIIDLSADFRIKDVRTYEKWYKIEHRSPQFIEEAVYGLCELNRDKIKGARLIANPGCYTTCSILTAYPLVKEGLIDPDTLIIDAKSGTSGAGRGAKLPNLFCEVNENMKAYGVTNHRHTPEIEEQLGYAAGKEIVNTTTTREWLEAAKDAYRSIYAYEWLGDSLLLAREALLLSFIEYYRNKFGKDPQIKSINHIAYIISWNVWQMDGLKGVVPDSCGERVRMEPSLFGTIERREPCEGCLKNDLTKHNGIYCIIKDWRATDKATGKKGKRIRFIDLINEEA